MKDDRAASYQRTSASLHRVRGRLVAERTALINQLRARDASSSGIPRMLPIHGARTALPGLAKKDTPLGRWVKALLARAHRNVVTVALANKLARIAWTVLARDRWYVAVQTAANSGGRGKGREV